MHEAGTDPRRWLRLRDGRRLAYTDTGPADGTPVIYCHGAIGTPVDATVDLTQMTRRLGIRYIAPSRPGIGGSDPQPGRTVLDFADDLSELAGALSLRRISLVGVSAGGPYALAAAHRLPEIVARVAVCSSLSPLWRPHRTPGLSRQIAFGLALVSRLPGLITRLGDAVLPLIARHPGLLTRVISAHAAPSERGRLATAGERHAASSSFLDAACAGVGGMVEDYLVYAQDWGFSPNAVRSEVHLWHGAGDPLVPIEHALALALRLPDCQVFVDPDEGHHFFRSRLGEILEALVGPSPARAGLTPRRAARRAVGVR